MSDLKYPGVFITGTDTGVGKTIVTTLLAIGLKKLGLDVGVLKPVASGALETKDGPVSGDALFLKTFAELEDSLKEINPVLLRAPIAPSAAARMEGVTIDIAAIKASYRKLSVRHEIVLVEGAGGILTPIQDTYLMRDLARDLQIPCLVVARASLGTVNHTALTIEALRASRIPILGVLLNHTSAKPGPAERTAGPLIEEITGVQIIGEVKHDSDANVDNLSIGSLLSTDFDRWCKSLLSESQV